MREGKANGGRRQWGFFGGILAAFGALLDPAGLDEGGRARITSLANQRGAHTARRAGGTR